MIQKIKRKMIIRACNKSSKKHHFISFEKAKSIGIIYDYNSEDKNLIAEYRTQWIKEGKTVETFCVVNNKTNKDENTNLYGPYIHKSKFNWLGLPKYQHIKPFVETPFDILLCLTTNSIDVLVYICAYSCAKFRVGPQVDYHNPPFELMLNTSVKDNKNLIAFFDKQLKIIKYEQI